MSRKLGTHHFGGPFLFASNQINRLLARGGFAFYEIILRSFHLAQWRLLRQR
jgi:hypothetical protein